MGTDLFSSFGLAGWTTNAHVYSHWGSPQWSFGPALEFQRPSNTSFDVLVGGGAKWEPGPFFLQLEGGFLFRQLSDFYGGRNGRGFYVDLAPGFAWGILRVSFPLLMRRMMDGLAPRWSLDFYPYIGVRFRI